MQPLGSPELFTSPQEPQGVPGGHADAPSPHREKTFFDHPGYPLSSLIFSSSPEFRLVTGMTVMMILLLGTLLSVSCYLMSARTAGMVAAVFSVFFAYSIIVAARCRHTSTNTRDQD